MKSSLLERLSQFVDHPELFVLDGMGDFNQRPDLYAPDADALLAMSPADLAGEVVGSTGTGMTCLLSSSTASFPKVRA